MTNKPGFAILVSLFLISTASSAVHYIDNCSTLTGNSWIESSAVTNETGDNTGGCRAVNGQKFQLNSWWDSSNWNSIKKNTHVIIQADTTYTWTIVMQSYSAGDDDVNLFFDYIDDTNTWNSISTTVVTPAVSPDWHTYTAFFDSASYPASVGSELAVIIGAGWWNNLGIDSMMITTGQVPDSIIDSYQQSQIITDWGYDCKWEWKGTLLTPTYADTVYVEQKFTMLRVPIWGNISKPAHPAAGVVDANYYASTLTAMTNVKNARPDAVLFASKKLEGQNSFPDWTKNSSNVIPSEYAKMLADFLEFMESNGFYIDALGIDNETEFNEGNITPWRHKEIVDQLKALAVTDGFNVPPIVGPENYNPNNANTWMDDFISSGYGDRLDIAGVHYYPSQRDVSKVRTFAGYAADRPIWHSEVHWKSDSDEITNAELSLMTVFDCFDVGFTGMSWWGYPFSGIRQEIAQSLSTSTVSARPISMDDIDGAEMSSGTLISRAFLRGNEVKIWVINNTSTSYTNYNFSLYGSVIMPDVVGYTQWTTTASGTGTGVIVDNSSFEIDIPANTITLIELTTSKNAPIVHYTFDGDANDSSGNGYNGTEFGSGISYTPGIIGQAVSLNGTDDYIDAKGFKGVVGQGDRTCAAWIKTTQADRQIMSWGLNDTSKKWIVKLNSDGTIRAEVNGGYVYGTTVLNDDQWHHIAVVFKKAANANVADILLYVDGQPEAIGAIDHGPIDTDAYADVYIGTFTQLSSPTYYSGLIDDLIIYDYALDKFEIADLYLLGVPGAKLCIDDSFDGTYDYNDDCTIDLADLARFSDNWLVTNGFNDYADLASSWQTDGIYVP